MTTTQPRIDLWHSASFSHGHPTEQYRWLLENAPVYWHEEPDGRGFWAVTSHPLVKEASGQNNIFSNNYGITMYDSPEEELAIIRNMMLIMDPPHHTQYRRLVGPQFLPREARSWTALVDELASEIVDEVCERGECDLVTDVAGKLPSYVVAKLLGIPRDEGVRLYDLTETMHSALDTVTLEQRGAAGAEMFAFASQLRAAKLAEPSDDLASKLVHAEVDGERLTEEQFGFFVLLLVNAGGDTTRALVGGAMVTLLNRPDVMERLRSDLDTLMPTAVEEMLRFQSPVIHMRRTALEDVRLGDVDIKKNDKVLLYYGAANRDPSVFTDPDEFILDRNPNPHVAFGGGGAHFCLGSHFARVEINAMMRQILTRLPDIELAGEPTWIASNFVSGPTSVPIKFTPSPKASAQG